jgi:hypothetical protein
MRRVPLGTALAVTWGMDIIGEPPRRRRIQHGTDVWIDVTVRLGGLVALFGGMAGALMLMLSSGPHP